MATHLFTTRAAARILRSRDSCWTVVAQSMSKSTGHAGPTLKQHWSFCRRVDTLCFTTLQLRARSDAGSANSSAALLFRSDICHPSSPRALGIDTCVGQLDPPLFPSAREPHLLCYLHTCLCSHIIRLPTGNVTCATTAKFFAPRPPGFVFPVFCGVAAHKEAASRMRSPAAAQHP